MLFDDRPLTFDPCFGKLGREIARFANHTHKLVLASQHYRDILVEASNASSGLAPLDTTPANPMRALRAIEKYCRSRVERRLDVCGAYFAHHSLRTQAELSRFLLRESFNPDPDRRITTCRRYYEESTRVRRIWVSALLDVAIAISSPRLSRRDYAAFNVGSLTDHEDVDLTIVVAHEKAQEALAQGFANVKKTFLRHASKIQLFLTEQLEKPRSAALVEEYQQLLSRPSRSIVSVMQLLGSQYLCGNPRLARVLESRVIDAYYAGPGRPITHEAFLRTLLVELRELMSPRSVISLLSPKRETYLPSKLAITASRLIHNVRVAHPVQALQEVSKRDPLNAHAYRALANAFVQNEVLRSLLFLYVFSGDEFDLNDPIIRAASRRVGLLLGLSPSARKTPEDRLVAAYTEIRATAIENANIVAHLAERHLKRVSRFRNIVEEAHDTSHLTDNLAERLLHALQLYRGSVFWDEVVDFIRGSSGSARRFLNDLRDLADERREEIAEAYVEMMSENASSLIEFLVFIALNERRSSELGVAPPLDSRRRVGPNANMFWRTMMRHLSTDKTRLDLVLEQLDVETRSETLHRLTRVYPPSYIAELADLFEDEGEPRRALRVVRTLRSLLVLAHHSSNVVRRIADRVNTRAPEFIDRIASSRGLKDLTSHILTKAAREQNPSEQIDLIGDAFDVSVLRAALMAVLDGAPAARDAEFTTSIDQYIRELFKACFREVKQRSPMFEGYRPGTGIALYSTGGVGRGEAFVGDWDYIAVIDEEDRGMAKFFGKVLQRVSGAMNRRGILPHNRFSAHFNAYVVSLPALRRFLETRTKETFVDEAEILEARVFLGDPAVARRFEDEIRALVLNEHAKDFMRDVLREIHDRRTVRFPELNLKLAPGGLREIHLLSLAIRLFAKLPRLFVPELLLQASLALPENKADLRFMMVASAELRKTRDLYHLVSAYDDTVDANAILTVAKDLVTLRNAGVHGDYGSELLKLLGESRTRIDRISAAIWEKAGL